MNGPRYIFAIIFAALILVFAIIHLGVSSSIVAKTRPYGNVFRPERGLAIFNIIISIFALIVGGFAVFALLTDRGILAKITGYVSAALAIFALASLIAALIINSLAITYTTSRFDDHLLAYENSQDSRNIINRIQTKYVCCGTDIWLDWSLASLNATAPATNDTLTTTVASGATTTAGGIATTTAGGTAATTDGGVAATTGGGVATTTDGGVAATTGGGVAATTDGGVAATTGGGAAATTDGGVAATTAGGTTNGGTGQGTRRRKRQAQSSYGGVIGLPTTFSVTLPRSCCTTDLSATTNLGNLYCISNANGSSNSIHVDGCSKPIGKFAIGQTLGLAVINSFLVVLSLAIIPLVIDADSHHDHQQAGPAPQQTMPYQQPGAPSYYPTEDHYGYQYPASYNNYGPTSYDNYGPTSYSYS